MKTTDLNQEHQCPETKETLTKKPNSFIMYGNVLISVFITLLFITLNYVKIDFIVEQISGNVFFKSGNYYFVAATNFSNKKNVLDKSRVALVNIRGGSLGETIPVGLLTTAEPSRFKITRIEKEARLKELVFEQQNNYIIIIKKNDSILSIFNKKIKDSLIQKYEIRNKL